MLGCVTKRCVGLFPVPATRGLRTVVRRIDRPEVMINVAAHLVLRDHTQGTHRANAQTTYYPYA